MTAHLSHESMSPAFEKWHLHGLPFAGAFHHFSAPDIGDPHDHPWGFTSHILTGGYVEEVFQLDGTRELVTRLPSTSHRVKATHIHRIVHLPAGECWTLIQPRPHERETRFWRFDDDGTVWSRPWHAAEFERYSPDRQA